MNQNDYAFYLSIIGTLSWIPVMYKYIKQQLEKPKIEVFPDDLLQIKENRFNVIINIRLGFYTKIKNGFIEKMSLVLVHTNGDKKVFKWAQVMEPLTQTTINDTVMPTSRLLNAIGYNLSKDTYIEPLVSFTIPDFRIKYEHFHNELRIKNYYLIHNQLDKKEVEASAPYINLCNVYKEYYIWKAGEYKCTLVIKTSDNQRIIKTFSFSIDETLAETLKNVNLSMILDMLKNDFVRKEEEKLSYDESWLNDPISFRVKV